jgi:hypothetical protein
MKKKAKTQYSLSFSFSLWLFEPLVDTGLETGAKRRQVTKYFLKQNANNRKMLPTF